MQHLNIPLSRNSQTTRRTRRVVWLLALVFLLVAIGSAWFSALWFTRDVIYSAAPEDTTSAFRFFVSGEKGKLVESFFGQVPLISNRSLLYSDISPYTNGEFVVFVSENGTRSVAIRLGGKPLPQSLLDSQSITSQSIGRKIVLLSEKPEKTKALLLKTKIIPGFSLLGRHNIGELIETSVKTRAYIYATKKYVEISLFGISNQIHTIKHIPENTIAYLSTPLLPKTPNGSTNLILPLLQFISYSDTSKIFQHLLDAQGQMILTKDKEGMGFYLSSKSVEQNNATNIEQLLRTIAALNSPTLQEISLDDGTSIKEIVANPDSFSVEQVTVLGAQINKIHTSHSIFLSGLVQKNEFFLTNREDLFRTMNGSAKSSDKICSGNIAGISFQPITTSLMQNENTPNSNAILLFAQNFSSLGIKKGVFSVKLRLCH